MKITKKCLALLIALFLFCSSIPISALAAQSGYRLNGVWNSWDGISFIPLTGDDTLVILDKPDKPMKIDVTSPDNANVTIIGVPDNCEDMYVAVANDITLNITNLNITAPDNKSGIELNKADSGADGMTINVSGACNIAGKGMGNGIASNHDQKLKITGNGTLNITGGSPTNGSDGGSGISMVADTSGTLGAGADLTIEGDVTVTATGGDSSASAGSGIAITWGNMQVNGGTVNARGGVSRSSSINDSAGIKLTVPFSNIALGGKLTVEGGGVNATGGNADNVYAGKGMSLANSATISGGTVTAIGGDSVAGTGGLAIYTINQSIGITGGTVTATGGNSTNSNGGSALYTEHQNITITGGSVTATGGNSVNGSGRMALYADQAIAISGGIITATGGHSVNETGGNAIYANQQNIDVTGGTVTVAGGSSDKKNGGVAMYAYGRDINLTGGSVTATGGNGDLNGAHAVFAYAGKVKIENSAAVRAVGGTGAKGLGGAGLRAFGYNSGTNSGLGNTVTVSASAGDVYVRGGQGASAQRPSVLGKDVYVAAGNIGSVVMEGTNPRSIKNIPGGDDLFMVNVSTNPAAAVLVQSVINGALGGSYTYRATTAPDGTACLWLPAGSQTLSATDYLSTTVTLTTDAAQTNPATINKYSAPDAPAASGAIEKIVVNSFTGGATLKLYRTDGRLIATADHVTASVYTFDPVEPSSLGYYITQTVNTMESLHSGTAIAVLRVPTVSAEMGRIDAGNIYPGAAITLYDRDGAVISSAPTDLGTGVFRFAGLTEGSQYYVAQSINGVRSQNSTTVTVPGPGAFVLNATPGNGIVDLTWTSVTDAVYYHVYQGPSHLDRMIVTMPESSYHYRVSGLTNGVSYPFEVKAWDNAERTVLATGQVSATPVSTPGRPAGISAVAGDGQAEVHFTAPDGGGSPITGYKVNVYINGVKQDSLTTSGSNSPISVTGLTNGQAYTFRVVAINGQGESVESEDSAAIIPYRPSNGGGGSGSGSSGTTPAVANAGMDVLVNGKAEKAGALTETKQGDKTVATITVDPAKLEQKLEAEGSHATVTIPVNSGADIIVGELNGQMVKNMESREALLEIKTPMVDYVLPAKEIDIEAISEQIGKEVALKDIQVRISIERSDEATVKVIENAAKTGEFTIVAPPVDFTINCVDGTKAIEVSKFNTFVERTLLIPEGVDPNKITTGVVVEPDGTVRHVPTRVIINNGKHYAVINSLTNSAYTVIWHPIAFQDAEHHWAKEAINNMGSRMVISGVGNGMFEPDREITRAEFAAIVVKGLGLKPGTGTNLYSDVRPAEWYGPFIQTAAAYGIISGYGDGTFGPDDRITREQAMTMMARAMKITGLKAGLKTDESDNLLNGFGDEPQIAVWAKESAAACVKTGIVEGKSRDMLAPKGEITRAEVAVIVQRLLKKSNLI
ncbi:hypothetical protein GTO89_15145 [Heliobacterium gestii]|uniref:S-layer homology domain-containing protein n=1 Tax=Heliomicrobium gestii TaxID=2699 RepID=A0A845LC25_HELGE|nr:S-layer homology domain-containing protein [Heliomicrobium gestii]MBM7868104.1 hypothetical protein [Heliomicrobium gestii]MZP44367.1 hypothetical protein [Heliomicrobium gestii]